MSYSGGGLLTCVACGGMVSPAARACPHCGQPAAPAPPHVPMPVPQPPHTEPIPGLPLGIGFSRSTWIAVCVGLGLILFGLVVAVSIKDGRQKDAVVVAESARAAQERAAAKAAASARAQAEADAETARAAAVASVRAQSSSLSKERREAWVRQCAGRPDCPDAHLEAIVAGAPAAEQRKLETISAAVTVGRTALRFRDGEHVDAMGLANILNVVDGFGLKLFDQMPSTTPHEAKKDSDGARGKAIRVTGSIIEIQKKSGVFEGSLATDGLTIVRFVTRSSTDGVSDGSWASFRGVYLQEYAFPNVSGGQTRSLLLVGAFDLPANR